ncbi:hypothetical protein E1B28_011030 [Marasmius oreades]|uniref:Endo-beta-1,6-galactanase-like domain-containing protein n=1 Tax=Marasmius oreades TaxID=181124 RepID=A0A9P7RTF2_9AGAR|nr:uncharacterized protein E1B28_011030 [Marasmius oreades]KAG7089337.1 hypothetical protein E1B28_011030 [Marasmius oreades]
MLHYTRIAAYLSLVGPSVILAATISSTPAQTILGIGGSGAWWPHDLFRFPEATRQNLSNLLFSQDGMGLSSYRWNVGAGGVGVSNPVRAPETFYLGPGNYNWSADPQGVYFLTEASKRGVTDLTMFANSAPAPLTSGKTSCGSNFVTGSGDAYGTFLADVVEHFRNAGPNIRFISPINEPDSDFGPVPCGQEGMKVVSTQRAEVVNGLWNALNRKGLATTVGILADESNNLGSASSEYKNWLPQVIDKVAALVHHTYDFPSDASYTSYISSTKATFPNKQTWMSEICCSLGNADGSGRGWSQGYDPTIKNALMFSGLIFQSFIVAGEPHYDFWTLVSNGLGCSPLNNAACVNNPNSNGWNDGLIYYDGAYATNRNFQLYLTKRFWTYKHFGNFIKPGSQRHAITGTGATNNMIAVSTSSKYFVVAMNPTNSATSLTLTFPENVCGVASYRTSASEDFAHLGAATKSGSNWVLPLNAMSLTTYEFNRAAC